ncbi:13298_t:CDS:2, partial [Dentiscutata erythropus]
MTNLKNKTQKLTARAEFLLFDLVNPKKKYKYICNCTDCEGKEIDEQIQKKHANEKIMWKSNKERKIQLAIIEARKFNCEVNENTLNKSSKKRKISSQQLSPVEDTTNVPKLNRDISVSDMLTGLGLGVASSSRSRNDQFHEPNIEETPDMYDDELLFDIGDEENYELIDDLEEQHDDDELIDDQEEGDDDQVEYIDIDNETPEDDDNLFAAPELEFLEALIKFLNNMLMMIDDSKFCEFPAFLFIAKKKLGIFQPKLRMAVCTNCHKLYDSKIVCNHKENNKLAIMHCNYEEYPNNPVLSRKNLCDNELSSLKRNMKNMIVIPRMLYPKPSIKQQLSIMYQRSGFEKMLDQSGSYLNSNQQIKPELMKIVLKNLLKAAGSLAVTNEFDREELQYFIFLRHDMSNKIYSTEYIPGRMLAPTYKKKDVKVCMEVIMNQNARLIIGNKIFGFKIAGRYENNAVILAKWEVFRDGTSDIYPGEVQYYFEYTLTLSNGPRTHLLAYVKWYKNVSSSSIRFKHKFMTPEVLNTELWREEYYEEGIDSIIAVHRIYGRAIKIDYQ